MSVTGRNSRAGFAIYGTGSWGVPASVTRALHVTGDSGLTLQPMFSENETLNQGFYREAVVGDITAPDLTLQMEMRYEDYAYQLEACAMGSPHVPTVVSTTGGNAYQHIIDLAPSVQGRGITFAVEYGGATFSPMIQELTSAKVYGFSETVGNGGFLQQSFRILGSKPTITSSVNFNSTLASMAVPGFGTRVTRRQGVLRLNAQDGAALSSSDIVQNETFDFEFTRVNDAPYVFGQDFIVEPLDAGFPTIRAVVQFPRMTTQAATSMYRALQVGGAWKGDLTYTGAYINSNTRYSRTIQMPYMEAQALTLNLAGPAQVKPSVTFVLKEVASAPAGMTGVTRPFRIVRTMANSLQAF